MRAIHLSGKSVWRAVWFVCAALVAGAVVWTTRARPRPLYPPIPIRANTLFYEGWDGALIPGMTNETLILDGYSLTQSWSGFALVREADRNFAPYSVPGFADTSNAAFQVWFTPDWTSAAFDPKATGPGADACLAELQAAGNSEAVIIWRLRISPDGSTISLLQENELGLVEMLSGEIAWAAGSPHSVALNYGTNGTQLFVDGQFLAGGAATLAVPSEITQFTLGSTLAGAEITGGAFDELYLFNAVRRRVFALDPLEVWSDYFAVAQQAQLGPILPDEDGGNQKHTAAGPKPPRPPSGGYGLLSVGDCVTNGRPYFTNFTATLASSSVTVAFNVLGGSNKLFSLYQATNVGPLFSSTNWHWLKYVTSCDSVLLTNQPVIGSAYLLGPEKDSDGDGMPDSWEVLNGLNPADPSDASLDPDGDGLTNLQEYLWHTDPHIVDSDYDGICDGMEVASGTSPTNSDEVLHIQLGSWRFDATNWAGLQGQLPLIATNLGLVPGLSVNAVSVNSNNPARLAYADTNGTTGNINLRKGSLRVWFRPAWNSSTTNSGSGAGTEARLIEAGTKGSNAWWGLLLDSNGTNISFCTPLNQAGALKTNLTATIRWTSNDWHQLVLTWSPTNSTLYLDGALATNAAGSSYWPEASVRAGGFRIGSDIQGTNQAKGRFDNLQTYNYVLSASEVATNYAPPCPALDVMLVIDRSGSMTNDSKIQSARQAATNFVNRLNFATDHAGLLTFATDVTLNLGLTNSAGAVLNAIGLITNITGDTYMSAGISNAQTELVNHHTAGALPVMVLLSDGTPTDTNGTSNAYAAAADAEAHGTRLITIALGSDAYWDLMQHLPTTTNDAYYATNGSQLDPIYDLIAASICRHTNAPPSVSITNPVANQSFTYPATITIRASAFDPEDALVGVAFYGGTNAIGTNYYAPFSATWTSAQVGTNSISAIAWDEFGLTAISTVNIVVGTAVPLVTITNPINSQGFHSPTNLTVMATAISSNGPIAWVEFYENSTNLLGITTNAPYQIIWRPVFMGQHVLTARAGDTLGSNAYSAAVTINVTNSPTVTLTNPANNAVFGLPNLNITNGAVATAYGGASITNVDFYAGATKLGKDTSAPYGLVWTNVQPGTYLLHAEAADGSGAIGVSPSVHIKVNPTNQPPVVDAGPDLTNRLPAVATLLGFVTDDGLPVGVPLSIQWSNAGGPGFVSFANSNSAVTTASFSSTGVYTLRLYATDTQFTTNDIVLVTVLPTNAAPVVDAGTNQTVTLASRYSINNLTGGSTTASSVRSSRGQEFWIGFPINDENDSSKQLSLVVSCETNALISLSVPTQGLFTNCAISPGVTTLPLPRSIEVDWSCQVTNSGIHLLTTEPVSVYGVTHYPQSTDAYLALPLESLGSNYIVMAWTNSDAIVNGLGSSAFLVVGTEKNTTLTIALGADAAPHSKGDIIITNLNAGEVFQVLADTGGNHGDLTGTLILANKRIAVFGGNRIGNVPRAANWANTLVEQIPATNVWGRQFVTVPLASRTNGDTFRILAAADDTTVLINGAPATTGLARTQNFTFVLSAPATIEATHPVLLAQFANAESVSGVPGDPFMMLVPPFEQFLSAYTVSTPALADGDWTNYVNIVVANSGTNSIVLDNTTVSPALFTNVNSSGFSFARLVLATGSHRMTGAQPFGISMYGFAIEDGYGYPGGMTFAAAGEVTNLVLAPQIATNEITTTYCLTAGLTNRNNQPIPGLRVDFLISGSNAQSGFAFTDDTGQARFCYIGTNLGTDVIRASVGTNAASATNTWERPSFTLRGFVHDDGLRLGVTNILWTQIGGPSYATIANTNATNTVVHVIEEGIYLFRLTADDMELTNYDDVSITVARNQPPSVNAGTNQTTKTGSIVLNGNVTDDGLPSGVWTATWSKIRGPGAALFSPISTTNAQPISTATFTTPGIYTLRLTASDSQASVYADVTVTNQIDPQRVSCGQMVTGSLSGGDLGSLRFTNALADYYVFSGRSNQTLVVSMASTNFDTYLLVRNTALQILGEDDDSTYMLVNTTTTASTSNSRIVFTLPSDGDFIIEATAAGTVMGAYSLSFLCGGVQITSPADGTSYASGSDVVVATSLAANVDQLTSFSIYTNGNFGGNVSLSTFSYNWYAVPAGNYILSAVATYSAVTGGSYSITSAPVVIIVGMPTLTLSQDVGCAKLLGQTNTLTAMLRDQFGVSLNATNFTFTVNGANVTNIVFATNTSVVSFSYPGLNWSRDVITASATSMGKTYQATAIERKWAFPLGCGNLGLGNLSTNDGVSARSGYSDYFSFSGLSNDTVAITLSSTNFDAYLTLSDMGCSLLASNDDTGGGGTDAKLTFTFPATGTYLLEASAFFPHQTGNYSLLLDCNPTTNNGTGQLDILSGGQVLSNFATVAFPVTTNGYPVTVTLTLTNPGTGPLYLSGAFGLAGEFVLTNLPCNPVPAQTATNFTIQFNASTNVHGTTNGVFTFASTAGPGKSPFTLNLLGVANGPVPPPTVSLTLPTNNAVFQPGVAVLLAATATNVSGAAIAKVEFYADFGENWGLMARSTSSPFTNSVFTNVWRLPPPGNYSVFAWVTDTNGDVGMSAKAAIQILPSTNAAPPLIHDDAYSVLPDSQNNVFPVLANDSDPNGFPLTIIGLTNPHPNLVTVAIINNGQAISFTPLPGHCGHYWITYTASNGHGGSDWGLVSVDIPVPFLPSVAFTAPASDTNVTAGTSLLLTTTGAAAIGTVASVSNYYGQRPLFFSTNVTLTTNWTPVVGTYNLHAIVTDSLRQQNDAFSHTITVGVDTAHDHNPPVAAIANITNQPIQIDGQWFTNAPIIREGLFGLTGTATDADVGDAVSYQLNLYFPDGTFAANITPGSLNAIGYHAGSVSAGGSLGTLDFTHIENGPYILQLIVRGGYRESTDEVSFVLDSNLKIGQFSFSQQDVALPVGGVPLTVVRTYNSMNLARGDFGYGWTWAFNDMDVVLDEFRENVPDLTDPDDTPFSQRTDGGRDVTLTLPDGRRTTFLFYYDGPHICTTGDEGRFCFFAKWRPAAGVTAKLETTVDNRLNSVLQIADGNAYWMAGDASVPMDNFDFPGFVLTTLDGTKYTIDREDLGEHDSTNNAPYTVHSYGQPYLSRIEDPNGNQIHIYPNAVVHTDSAGHTNRQVAFQRNDTGLITGVFDPLSQSATNYPTVTYGYDNNYNLINVARLTDRTTGAYLTNTFAYTNTLHPHYITGIIDPRGLTVARNEYDDAGKLIAVVDASGTRTEFSHDANGQTERVVDRLGFTNIFAYDLRGNVTATTNALGLVARMGYDDNNRQTALTNAFGTTTATWTLTAYDTSGNPTNVVTSPNHTNSSTYDGLGNLLSQTDPLSHITSNEYDADGNLTATTNALNATTTYSYSHGLLRKVFSPLNLITENTYDDQDNMTGTATYSVVDVSVLGPTYITNWVSTNSFTYDANGNQIGTSRVWVGPGGATTTVTTRMDYDDAGRVIAAVDADGNTNRTFYNALGKVDYSVDKLGNTNRFVYDSRGNLIQTTSPEGLVTRTVYDAAGRAYLTTDRNGLTGTLTQFDPLGRATNTVRLVNVVVRLDPDPNNPDQLVTAISSFGTTLSTSSVEYLPSGWVKSRTGPDGATTSYDYWLDGQVKTVTDALTNVTYYEYDPAGHQSLARDASNRTNRFDSDPVGQMVRRIFADNTSISNEFNLAGQRVGQIDQANIEINYGYTPAGQLTNVLMPSVLDPEAGNAPTQPAWNYLYDDYARLVAVQDAKGRSTTNTYDALGRQVTRRLPMGETETNIYNALGQLWKKIDFKGQTNELVYDKLGRVKAKYWFAHGSAYPSNAICYQYNTLGKLIKIIERNGPEATTNTCDGYAALVHPIGGLGGGGVLAVLARLSTETQGSLTGVLFSLVVLGFVCLKLVGKRSIESPFLQNLAGLRLPAPNLLSRGESTVSPLLTSWRPLRLVARSFARAWRLLLGACSSVPFCSKRRLRLPSLRWRYVTYVLVIVLLGTDPRLDFWSACADCPLPNNLSTETTRITTFAYDPITGGLAQQNTPEGVINYGYDLTTGRHTSTCTTNSYIEYSYDKLGRLKSASALKRNGVAIPPEVTTYTYTAVGSRSSVSLPNGIITTYLYDGLNRLTNLTHILGGTNLLASYSYQLHPTGRRTNAVEIVKTEDTANSYLTNTLTWKYDGMYRLTNEISLCSTNTGTYTNDFQYDKVGNRFARIHYQNGNITTTTNLYNAADQLLKEVTNIGSTLTETNLYTYDGNGSLISKTNISSASAITLYGYDLKNKLSDVTSAGTGVTNYFVYNDQGIRVRSTVGGAATYYLIDANNHTGYQQILEELTAPGATPSRSYVIGDDVLAQGGSAATYLLYDGHGSTRQIADASGGVMSRYYFDAYGLTLGNSTSLAYTSLLFCGERVDTTLGMYNLRARLYDPSNGRFTQRDPLPGSSQDPSSLHKYAYCTGDPVNNSDPSGKETLGSLLLSIFIVLTLSASYVNAPGPGDVTFAYNGGSELIVNIVGGHIAIGLFRIGSSLVRAGLSRAVKWSSRGGGQGVRVEFEPIDREAPVGSDADSFADKDFEPKYAPEDLIVYRAEGGKAKNFGWFFNKQKPITALDAEELSNISKWGNSANTVVTYRIPKGTKIYEGPVEGGVGQQIFLKNPASKGVQKLAEEPLSWSHIIPSEPPGSILQ